MNPLNDLGVTSILTHKGLLPIDSALADKDFVVYYYSAVWCRPCDEFLPKVVRFYNFMREKRGKNLEVVFVSGDRNLDDYTRYYDGMPWAAVPFEEGSARLGLQKVESLKFAGFPHVVIISKEGKVMTTEGRACIEDDAETFYRGFPWIRRSPAEMFQEPLVRACATAELVPIPRPAPAASPELWGLFVTASWCGPCRQFTPKLAAFYEHINREQKRFEVVTASWDHEEELFKSYCASAPWLALPWQDPRHSAQCAPELIESVPALLLYDREMRLVSPSGRDYVDADPTGAHFPWPNGIPLPSTVCLDNLTGTLIEKFESLPSVALNANETILQQRLIDAFGQCKGACRKPVAFDEVLLLHTLPRPARANKTTCMEGHTLVPHDLPGLTCDFCSSAASPSMGCRECDFDLCEECFERGATPLNRSQGILAHIRRLCEGNEELGLGGPDAELCFFDMQAKKWFAEPLQPHAADDPVLLAQQVERGLKQLSGM